MRVAVVTEPYKVEILEMPVPEIKEHDVLIQTVVAGICGSDLHLFKGTHAFRKPPAPLGHEIAGVVKEVGSAVKHIKVGDRVTVEPQVGCGQCEYCQSGRANLCEHKMVPGTPSWGGTFAEYFVAPEQTIYRLGDSIDFETGALVEPLAVAVQAMNTYSGKSKDSIAILGCGTIGLLTLAVAKKRGFQRIYCTDPAPFNRKLAIQMGADAAYDPITCDAVQEIRKGNGDKGVTLCVIAAGAANIVDQASALTKKQGQIVLVSMITKPIPIYTYSLVFNEQRLKGSMTYTSQAFEEACRLVNEGIDIHPVITHNLPMEKTMYGLNVLDTKKEDAGKILIHPSLSDS